MFIRYGLLLAGLAVKQAKHHLNLIRPNWPKQITIYRLCLLFLLISCFSITMLTLTQILLTTETAPLINDNLIWRPKLKNLTNKSLPKSIRQKLLSKIQSTISLQDYLANYHQNKIDDHLFSINRFNNDNSIDDDLNNDNNNNQHFFDNKTVLNPIYTRNDDYWQRVRSSSQKFYIFSAYIDSYNRSNLNHYLELNPMNDDGNYFIRIIAVTQLTNNEKLICSFDNNNNNDDRKRKWFRMGRMKPIREHWNLKYSAYFIYCPIPKQLLMINSKWIQLNVQVSLIAIGAIWRSNDIGSLVNNNNAQYLNKIVPSNRLSIHSYNNDNNQEHREQFRLAVCVKPLHYYYNKTINLIEFIELNRLLGVERFYFYNHTVDWPVDQLLRIYQQIIPGLIRIMQWQLPIKSQTEIRTEGIFAALNDCLYRARTDGYSYAIFIDLDEFIIPNRHRNLLKLLKDLQPIYRQMVGAYSFRNGFFYLQYPDDVEMEHDSLLFDKRWSNMAKQLITLKKTFRRADLNVHKQRSKCIVLTDHTIEMGNHFVWEFSYGKHTLNIDPKIAYLHHYRICEFGGDSCVYKNHPIIDRRTHYWANDLLNAIRKRLESICDRIPMDACKMLTI